MTIIPSLALRALPPKGEKVNLLLLEEVAPDGFCRETEEAKYIVISSSAALPKRIKEYCIQVH